jgi:hypothetical protein
VDWTLARPDHKREVYHLRVIAVTTLNFKQLVTAMQRICNQRRRLIVAAQEQPRAPYLAV